MRSIRILFLLGYFFTTNEAKVFDKCELAKILKDKGLDGYSGYNLANWVCLAAHETQYNTQAKKSKYADGSTHYGIFQVNNRWWCADGNFPSKNYCNIECSKLLDDNISDDIECVKKIVKHPNKMYLWVKWSQNCRNRNLYDYVSGCTQCKPH